MDTILLSLDIDGTIEVGDPPGVLTMDMIRTAVKQGFIVGSCSDRPLSTQRKIFAADGIEVAFAVSKHMLPQVMEQFEADEYVHVGDREDLDKRYALAAGFSFLWPEEAAEKAWFFLD